jgi:hypothetical protein
MKHPFAAAMLSGVLLGAAALAQSPAPTGPTAPSAAKTTPQRSQASNSAPIQANHASQAATTPEQGATATLADNSDVSDPKRLAPGSVIPVRLTKTIDAKKAKTGDQVVAKVMHDMRSTIGQVVIAKDTKVIGHITEAQPRSKEKKESQLALAFDRTITKGGKEVQISMSIQAVIGQENNQDADGNDHSGEAPTPEPRTMQSPMSRPTAAPPTGPPPSADGGEGVQTPRAAPPAINAHTQGVVGISNLSLQQVKGDQASVMTSEKNNVKLESGTMLLLKVNQFE